MLAEEAEYWWDVFRNTFLEKYFIGDARSKKEMDFLALTQGSMSVADYADKFEELFRFCPHYNAVRVRGIHVCGV
jgi:hypothetical protein